MTNLGKSAPSAPAGDGNTETSPDAGNDSKNSVAVWDFTLNNYTEDEVLQWKEFILSNCKKGGFGFEIAPTTGTPHLQGYINLIKKNRKTALIKLFPRASFRPCRNEKALIDYIQKSGNFWSHGLPKPLKIISTLKPWQKEIEDIYLSEPDDRTIHWFWEPNGGVGKSAFVKYLVVKYKALFCDGGKKADLINLVFNNNMDDCKAVIWDLPRDTKNSISYTTLEAVKNGLVCNTKYETGVKAFNPPHIFVFSNYAPDTEHLSADRWVVKEIKEMQTTST